jgi:hypothetical protein
VLVVGCSNRRKREVQKPPITKGKVNQSFLQIMTWVWRRERRAKRRAKTMARGSEGL